MKMRTLAAALVALSWSAHADIVSMTSGYDYTDYSGGHGKRDVASIELKTRFERGAVVGNFAYGHRDYGGGNSFTSSRGRGTLWYNWNTWLSTRTVIALAENTPVFARRDFQQDVTVKAMHNLAVTAGYRHANYFDDVDVNAWSGGLSLYTGPFITSWRYTNYDTTDAGHSYSHVASIKMKDPSGGGSTQLWLSRGTGAYTYDWAPQSKKGTAKGVSLRRVQPLTQRLLLGVVVGKQWYDTPTDSYSGLQGMADLTWHF